MIPVILVMFFLNKEGKFFENLQAFMNGWKGQLGVEVRSLYNLTLCFVLFWSWEFDSYQGKAGILKSEACGNLEKENH